MAHAVFVGLSGGVDSAVSAALLKESGVAVTGAFIKIWQPEFLECTWREDRLDAMRVCATLGIPFREVDLSAEYRREVADEMLREYAGGRTPNPDVLCNSRIKFGVFRAWALAQGAHLIATGHYARRRESGGHHELLRARDASKDQSYFLYRLRQAELARALFPVGEMTKEEVRAAARRLHLPVADKPDSQGLCFVGEVSMREFLSRFIPVSPGPVVDMQGKEVGEHEGAALYTIGQRHGFASPEGGGAARYVAAIDIARNTIVVSPRREDAARRFAYLEEPHWIHREERLPLRVLAQCRYREPPVRATVSREGERLRCEFDAPRIVAPGQSVVLYADDGSERGEQCLGGGVAAFAQTGVHISR